MRSNRPASLVATCAGLCLGWCAPALALIVTPPDLTPVRAFPNPTNQTGQIFGISLVRLEGGRFAVGAQDFRVGTVNAAGAVYIFDLATGAKLSTILNPFPTVSAAVWRRSRDH